VLFQHEGSAWDAYDDAADASLDANAHYFWSFEFKQKVYIGDGVSEIVFDPKSSTVSKWESEGSGTLPEKCALATVYRSRVVLGRAQDAPQNWFMSAVDDAGNWDFFPPTLTVDMAVAGNNTQASQCPDIINALISVSDDYMIFGGDHSIWLLRGDPLEFGGFHQVSKTIGIAYGNAWTQGPDGTLFFFGSKGGVYSLIGGAESFTVRHLSDALDGQDTSIQSQLRDIDLSAFRIELEWDFERQGLIVVQIPYSETITEASRAWFWDMKNNAWWPDLPGTKTLQPYSTFVFDGDLAADRRVVYGCEDGYIRELDSAAWDDDSTAIDAFVTIGPIAAGDDAEIILNRLKPILASEQDGCTWTIRASNVPGVFGPIVKSGNFTSGLNRRINVNKRGSFLWLQIRNSKANSRFAIEEIRAEVVKAGLRVVRS
jgi:hypothetical protein